MNILVLRENVHDISSTLNGLVAAEGSNVDITEATKTSFVAINRQGNNTPTNQSLQKGSRQLCAISFHRAGKFVMRFSL